MYTAYFDSGTSNSRIYILNENLETVYTSKIPVGSKDSAAAGSNRILLEKLKGLYDKALKEVGIEDRDVERVFASGMATSPYGIHEIPHRVIPMKVEDFIKERGRFIEDRFFHRQIELIPGLKTVGDDISMVNNMRGEEIEIIGALQQPELSNLDKPAVMILPGSHTHSALVMSDQILDILSTFSGELFYALKTSTVLAPVLSAECPEFDSTYVKKGFDDLKTMGFNRAIYIAHAMRIFEEGTQAQRVSYAEGVIMGGIINAIDYRCKHDWSGVDTAFIVTTEPIYNLFRILMDRSECIRTLKWLPIDEKTSYALEGLKKIINSSR